MPEIELILKSPTDRIAPFTIKCNILWTIKQLKEHIKNIYPLKPTVESQKVIYVGKLLKDDQILKNLFEPESSTIVHFICQSSINENEKKVDDVSKKAEITADKCPDLYKEYQNYVNNYYASTSQSFAAMNHYQQMMWFNHAYMQSYASYCAQFSTRSDNNVAQSPDPVVQPTIATSESGASSVQQNNQDNQPNNERRIDAPAENGMQNMMAAAFGGLMGDGGEEENDGDVEPRDILHYFYILVRFGLLLLICYYYSSVASVVTTLMLFFLFFGVNLIRRNNNNYQNQNQERAAVGLPVQLNVINPQQEQQQPGDSSAPPPADQQQSSPSDDSNEKENVDKADRADNNQATSIDNSPPSPAAIIVTEPLPTITERLKRAATTSLQFVLTFFVTLFPEPIAQIDIN